MRGSVWLLGLLECCSVLVGAEKAAGDHWLTNRFVYPSWVTNATSQTNGFGELRAEGIAGRLRIIWPDRSGGANRSVVVLASADEPGHWPVRDWRAHEMRYRGSAWEATVDFESLAAPIIYFVQVRDSSATNLSLMRICWPRQLGLEEPTQLPWNFIEGFEEGLTGWSIVAVHADADLLAIDPLPRSGRAALSARLPPEKTSVTVGTARIRGWQILERGVVGLRLWMRTRQGTGRARFTLHANAHSPEQTVCVSETLAKVGPDWQQVDLPFASFPRLPLADVDWFTIEFVSAESREVLIDDVQFAGKRGRELE